MKTFTDYIDKATEEFFADALSRRTKHPDYRSDEVMDSYTIEMQDGYFVDFVLVNGDESAGPYLDVILFHNGHEVQVLQPSFQRLSGKFHLADKSANQEFQVVIEILTENPVHTRHSSRK